MSPLIDLPEHIMRVRKVDAQRLTLPWNSFADFFKARIYDRALMDRTFLTYCDDDKAARSTYSYAEFGAVVQLVATFLHDHAGVLKTVSTRK